MQKRKKKVLRAALVVFLSVLIIFVAYGYFSQKLLSHAHISWAPEYEKVELTARTDPETVFLQTGLGPAAAKKVLEEEGLARLQWYQEAFFGERTVKCRSVMGFWLKTDLLDTYTWGPALADLQPGDMIVSLSGHSFGWRHGHCGLVLGDGTTLEAAVIGENTKAKSQEHWRGYCQFAVLRLKGITPAQQQELAAWARENLVDVPYDFMAGLFGEKAPALTEEGFGVQCSYLIWYAYAQFGYDLDSDGGGLVTTHDILHSPLVEVVQVYGMDPREFLS